MMMTLLLLPILLILLPVNGEENSRKDQGEERRAAKTVEVSRGMGMA